MSRIAIIGVLALCYVNASMAATSKGPGPGVAQQPSNTQVTKQSSKPEERGTENSPLIVKLATADKSSEEAADERKDAHNQTAAIERTYAVTGWLAFFTLILAVAATWQVWETRRTAKLQLRAYISVDTQNVEDHEGQAILNAYGIKMSNFGQTPAYRLRALSNMRILDCPPKVPFSLNQPGPSTTSYTLLSPSEPRMLIKRFDFSDEDVALIDAGTHALYWWGRIEYEDTFNGKHWTTFCYYRDKNHEHLQRWAHHASGNDADRGNTQPPF